MPRRPASLRRPLQFIRSRFSISSLSLWRVMKLLRPYRGRIVLANVMASMATATAGLCLVALHPLFQIAMNPNFAEAEVPVATAENFQAGGDSGVTGSGAVESGDGGAEAVEVDAVPEPGREAVAGDAEAASEGGAPADAAGASEVAGDNPLAARLEGVRKFADRLAAESALVASLVERGSATWERFSTWAKASGTRLMGVYVAFLILLYLLSQFFSFLGSYILGQVSLRVTMQMMRDVYANVLRQEYNYFNTNTSGNLLNLCYRQVMQLRTIVNFLVSTRIMIPVNMVILFLILVGISRQLSIILLLLMPLVVMPALFIVRHMKQSIADEIDEETGAMEVMSEGLHGILAIKAFGAERLEQEQLEPAIMKYVRSNRRRQAAASMMGPTVDFMNMMVILIVFVLTMSVMRKSLGLDSSRIILFMFAMTRFHKPLRELLTMNLTMQRSAQVAHRIFQLLDREPEIREEPDAVAFPRGWRSIDFQGVSLIYFAQSRKQRETAAERRLKREAWMLRQAEEQLRHMRTAKQEEKLQAKKKEKKEKRSKRQERPALLNVDLRIRRGEKIALIGPNGAGKSSLVNLLCRLYDPTEGTILIDGVDYSKVRPCEVHEHVCLVTQHPVLFNRSVRENISFGKTDLTDDQIENAARATGAHEFITKLPEGYATNIGEGGRHLSGGERQKIALARAFVRNPDILILDEPTTGLDYRTTQEFMDLVFHPRNAHLTLIFITHEPSQLPRFERILRITADKQIAEDPPMRAATIDLEHETLAGQQYPA